MPRIILRNSGKPELRCNPSIFVKSYSPKTMDARVISAFTRVFDALLPAHDTCARMRCLSPGAALHVGNALRHAELAAADVGEHRHALADRLR